jgi:hypothetical protein
MLFDHRHGYERVDVCQDCWERQYSQGASDRKGFVSHWQGTFEPPAPPPAEPIEKERAETLLRKLIELDDPKYIAACYILAVMLERKRLLKVQTQLFRDGDRLFVYEHPKTGDLFTILDPNLQMDELDTVQHTVAHLIVHGLNGPPPPGAADSQNGGEAVFPPDPASNPSQEDPSPEPVLP